MTLEQCIIKSSEKNNPEVIYEDGICRSSSDSLLHSTDHFSTASHFSLIQTTQQCVDIDNRLNPILLNPVCENYYLLNKQLQPTSSILIFDKSSSLKILFRKFKHKHQHSNP